MKNIWGSVSNARTKLSPERGSGPIACDNSKFDYCEIHTTCSNRIYILQLFNRTVRVFVQSRTGNIRLQNHVKRLGNLLTLQTFGNQRAE